MITDKNCAEEITTRVPISHRLFTRACPMFIRARSNYSQRQISARHFFSRLRNGNVCVCASMFSLGYEDIPMFSRITTLETRCARAHAAQFDSSEFRYYEPNRKFDVIKKMAANCDCRGRQTILIHSPWHYAKWSGD